MVKQLTSKIINEKQLNSKLVKKTLQIKANKKFSITLQDLKGIEKTLRGKIKERKGYITKYAVYGGTVFNNYFNIKSYDDDFIRYDMIDDYLSGRVKDTSDFKKLNYINIIISEEKI